MGAPSPAFVTALADRYRIERELGAGGMATVYLAEDLKHRRQVAIKVLRDDLTASLGKERFLREISIAAGLTHPHILPLHDSGEAAGHLFYVMPFVDGQTLRQRLVRTGELPIGEAVRALRDVADAMSHAHKRNVVHRDLKPENVMLSDRHAVVMDFGVAKALTEATGKQQLTTMGVALGTPSYMSPEQATADPLTDHRSDIYSFGIIAYELLTGRTPFAGGSPQEMLAAHVTAAVPPITTHRASIPPALAGFVMRCLEKKPADRWQSADELIPQLEALLTPSGGITPHQTAPYAATPRVAGNRRARLIAIASVIVLAAAAALYSARGPIGGAGVGTSSTDSVVWVAVLPPENQGRPDDAWFGDGLADEIRGALLRVPGVLVKGGRSSQTFEGTTKTIPQIGAELDVPFIVTTKVRWVPGAAGTGQITAVSELLDATTEAVRSRQSIDTSLTDLFAGQVAVAQRLVLALSAGLPTRAASGPAVSTPATALGVKPDAYAVYLSGRAAFNRYTLGSRKTSLDLLTRAVELDPAFGKAHAWLAYAMFDTRSFSGRWSEAEFNVVVEKALALSPNDPDALGARGTARQYRGEWRGARDDLERAIALDPTQIWAYLDLMRQEAAQGNFDRSIELARRAAAIDPVIAGDLVPLALAYAGRMDEAVAASRAGLAIDSSSSANDWYRAISWSAAMKGDVVGYQTAEARVVALGRDSIHWQGIALANAGRRGEARAHLATLQSRRQCTGICERAIVYTLAALGELDSAFAKMGRDLNAKSELFIYVLSPALVAHRSDPRFIELLKRIGLR